MATKAAGARSTVFSLIEKVNAAKLHPIASLPPMQRRRKRTFSTVNTKGKVFRIQQLHSAESPSAAAIARNNRGFTSSKRVTAAHAPSMYHWLFHRCGVAFEESKRLVEHKRLLVNGAAIDKPIELEYQMDWETFRTMNITLRMPTTVHTQGAMDGQRGGANSTSMVEVPALQRALHRSYALMLLDRRVSMSSDVADPRSFVHRLERLPCLAPVDGTTGRPRKSSRGFTDDTSRTAVNILRPPGVVSRGVHGLVLATNDCATVRFWNNEYLGNVGVYDVRFPEGAPMESYVGALRDINETLRRVRADLVVSPDVVLPCHASLENLEENRARGGVLDQLPQRLYEMHRNKTASDSNTSHDPDDAAVAAPSALLHAPLSHAHRILVETPMLPFRLLQRLRRNGAFVSLVKMGPFQLPATLLGPKQRLLSVEELVAFFAFEKRMKTNLLVFTLREFERGGSGGAID